jgi:hypothetical protein
MYLSLKQSSTSSGMDEQSKGCWEIPPIFWLFLSKKLKHLNPQVLFLHPNGMAKTTYVHFYSQSKSIHCLETNL